MYPSDSDPESAEPGEGFMQLWTVYTSHLRSLRKATKTKQTEIEGDRQNGKKYQARKKKVQVITRSACHSTITITLNLKWPFKGQQSILAN